MPSTGTVTAQTSLTAPTDQTSSVSSVREVPVQLECDWYTQGCEKPGACPSTKKCDIPSARSENKPACVAVWRNDTATGVQVLLKNCMPVQHIPPFADLGCGSEECVASRPSSNDKFNTSDIFVCCCHKPRCNRQFSYHPSPASDTSMTTRPTVKNLSGRSVRTLTHSNEDELTVGFAYILFPICLLTLLFALGYWIYRKRRLRRAQHPVRLEYSDKAHATPLVWLKGIPTPGPSFESIQLNEIVSKGRFGCVWKASFRQERMVAVKVFPPADADSWIREQEIYGIKGMKEHSSILQFIVAGVHGSGTAAEYWLVTAYHEHGSLHDFLKRRVLNPTDSFRFITSMLDGLTFLHEEDIDKPTIVHRDFKSKNVLVRNDMSICIADFGLAVVCGEGYGDGDIYKRVGTSWYMAPEVLQGATEFNAPALRRMDVYACALVVWEIMSRTDFEDSPIDQHRLPFEDFMDKKLNVQDLLRKLEELVVYQKRRPLIKQQWREHLRGKIICTTIEEMWDQEAEARLTAGCALIRLQAQQCQIPTTQPKIVPDTTPLITDPNRPSTGTAFIDCEEAVTLSIVS